MVAAVSWLCFGTVRNCSSDGPLRHRSRHRRNHLFYADVMELVDMPVSKSGGVEALCGFDSHHPYLMTRSDSMSLSLFWSWILRQADVVELEDTPARGAGGGKRPP